MPKIHPRELIVRKAANALAEAILKTTEDLTENEALSVVNGELSRYIGGVAKYGIREERHPGEPDTPGGWE